MRPSSLWILAVLCAACTGPLVAAQSPRWTADSVLKQLDAAEAGFHSLTADVQHIKYTDVVKDTSTESGQIFVRRDGKMRIEIKSPDARTILRTGDSLFIYNPKIKRVEEYDLGKNRAIVDEYLRLGFGTKGEHLKKSYLVAVLGEDTLDDRKAVILELTPKSEQVRSQIVKIQMWIDESAWIPLQQKFFEAGSADYSLFHYTNIVRNGSLDDSRFKQDWPKGTTRVKPRF